MALLPSSDSSEAAQAKLPHGLYAIFETSMGKITCKLLEKEAPKTVENFVGLAEGTKEWTDLKTGQKVKRRFYDGLIFHRVIPQFMIQGGDPTGTGMGGPGYQFADEFNPNVKFDQPGRLAMANAGPNTNGSQFFITEVPTPHLDNRHTIFGQCIEGMDVVKRIATVPTGPMNKPAADVVIKKLTILRKK
jgi:peptidyl-prolyl cis-trans isomerase A (cyclophilin A)